MKESKPYAELVTQAEEATRAIKDPELRRGLFLMAAGALLASLFLFSPAPWGRKTQT